MGKTTREICEAAAAEIRANAPRDSLTPFMEAATAILEKHFARHAERRAVLEKLEWCGPFMRANEGNFRTCPICGNFQNSGHARLCELAAALKED